VIVIYILFDEPRCNMPLVLKTMQKNAEFEMSQRQ
jgi:hypothetical protein